MDNETLPSAPPGGPHRVFLSGNVFNFGPNFERVAAYLRTAGYDVTVGPRAAPGVQMEFPRAELAALFGRMDQTGKSHLPYRDWWCYQPRPPPPGRFQQAVPLRYRAVAMNSEKINFWSSGRDRS